MFGEISPLAWFASAITGLLFALLCCYPFCVEGSRLPAKLEVRTVFQARTSSTATISLNKQRFAFTPLWVGLFYGCVLGNTTPKILIPFPVLTILLPRSPDLGDGLSSFFPCSRLLVDVGGCRAVLGDIEFILEGGMLRSSMAERGGSRPSKRGGGSSSASKPGRNKVDCGVYLMCHMESYAREGVARWECGLVRGVQAELDRLPLHYMKEIYTADINSHNTSNVACALRFLSSPLATSND
nr:zinc finger BED domain-containing protein RICESLEEPER 2-like [Ipomoea batatas]